MNDPHLAPYSKPYVPGNIAPVPIRMQDLQAAIGGGVPLLVSQQHYYPQAGSKPVQGQGFPAQGYQNLLGNQQLTQYHQRGLLQGQQSKAAMGQQQQQGQEKGGTGGFRPPISLAPLPARLPQAPRGQIPASHISLAPLPVSNSCHPTTNSQSGAVPQSLPQYAQAAAQYSQGTTSYPPQEASRPMDHPSQPAHTAAAIPQGQPSLEAAPGAPAQSAAVQQQQGVRTEGVDGGTPNLQPRLGMPSLPVAQQDGDAGKRSQLHFIPPGSAVIQPGPPMIHPGSTYNDAVWPLPCFSHETTTTTKSGSMQWQTWSSTFFLALLNWLSHKHNSQVLQLSHLRRNQWYLSKPGASW